MIGAAHFRDLALSMPEAVEGSHFGTADFRVSGRIFATLRPDGTAVVKLTPDDRQLLTETMPGLLAPVAGGWGAKGWTRLDLAAASREEALHLLAIAWRTVAPKRLLKP